MAEVRHLGYFPFCIRERAEDGQPFRMWDGSTFHTVQYTEDGETAPNSQWIYQDIANVQGTIPSKSSSKLITVYGDGTDYFIGPLSLEELMYFYWRPKQYVSSIDDQYQISIDGITNTYGRWVSDNNFPTPNYTWISETETLNSINKTLIWPNDQHSFYTQINTFVRFMNEKQLVCSNPYGNTPFFFMSMEFYQSNDASNSRVGEVRLTSDCTVRMSLDYQTAIKVSDDTYYLKFTGLGGGVDGINFKSIGFQEKYTETAGTSNPLSDVVIEYKSEVFAYGFPYPSLAEINPLNINTSNPPPVYLSDKEIFLTINFPSGSRVFKTRVFMSDWSGFKDGNDGTIIHLTDGPMLKMSINFPEHFEYDPNDGKGPIYDKYTGAKIRTDR